MKYKYTHTFLTLFSATILFVMTAGPVVAQLQTGLEIYTRTDAPADWTGSPVIDGVWTQQGVGSSGLVSVPGNGSVFFAFENIYAEFNEKAFNVEFSAAPGDIPDLTIGSVTGHTNEDMNGSSTVKVGFQKSALLGLINVNATFFPQPEWESVEVKNNSGAAIMIQVASCASHCSIQHRIESVNGVTDGQMEFSENMFGGAGLLPNTAQYTEIEIYPRNVAVDLGAPQTILAPPHTGNWNFDFAFSDPVGTPRPGGGVRFTSDGPGLTNGEIHQIALSMTSAADSSYDFFVLDSSVGQYQRLFVDLRDLPWYEDFETHYPDVGADNWRAWKGWDDDPAFDAPVTQQQSSSGSNSVVVDNDADLVREFEGADSGYWVFSAWQYIPVDFESGGGGLERGSWFLLLNTYNDGGPYHWSVGLQADSDTGLMKIYQGDGANTFNVPYETDRWVRIQAEIDLNDDWTQVYYDDELVAEYSWTGGILGDGGGALDIAAVDLFANNSTSIYYDDLSLTRREILLGDVNLDGSVNLLDVGPFIDRIASGEFQPEADTNQDGEVNLLDVGPFINILGGG